MRYLLFDIISWNMLLATILFGRQCDGTETTDNGTRYSMWDGSNFESK